MSNSGEHGTLTGGPGGPPVRVVLADDHDAFRTLLSARLAREPTVEVLRSCRDGAAAVAACDELHPDAVILDLHMPGLNGIEAALTIRAGHAHIRIVILSAGPEPGHIDAAIEAGAVACILKGPDVSELLTGLRVAMAGDRYVSPGLL